MFSRSARHDYSAVAVEASSGSAGPVVLGTLSVPIDPGAEQLALESTLEAGTRLVIADMLTLSTYPLLRARDASSTESQEIELEAVRDTARRAIALGIETELLFFRSPRPVRALLDVARDCRAGLLVFGPERSLIRPRQLRGAERTLRRRAPCLLWIAPDG